MPTTSPSMRSILVAAARRFVVLSHTDAQLVQLLRTQLHLDGRVLRSNGVHYYPALEAPTPARMKVVAAALSASGWTVQNRVTFTGLDGPGMTMLLVHADSSRQFNLLQMTTELSCVALSSQTPSVFDL